MESNDYSPLQSGNPPPYSPPPGEAQPPSDNPPSPGLGSRGTLLFRYNRYRLALRWILRISFLLIVLYGIVVIETQRTPQSALDSGQLGPGMAVSGSTIVLTHTTGTDRELLVSRDSGQTFTLTDDQHLSQDTSVFLAVAPDSQTVLALEANGNLHYLPANGDRFQITQISIDGAFNGLAFVPKTDSLYAYGNSAKITGLLWNYPEASTTGRIPLVNRIRSLAFNIERDVALIGTTPESDLWMPYFGRTLASISLYDTSGKDANYSDIPARDSNYKFQTVGYSWDRDGIYVSFYHRGPPRQIDYAYIGITDPPLSAFDERPKTPKILNSRVSIDTAGLPVYFGNGPYIQRDSILDSIPNGSDNLALGLIQGQPHWALAENSGKHYLYQKTGAIWTLNPVLIRPGSWPKLQNYNLLLIVLLLMLAGVLWFLSRSLSKYIVRQVPSTVNELLTKSEKPLGLVDTDLLGFSSIEEAVTRIIRNPQLDLPMTIVISGTWGSGKSSMMNRIREQLQKPELRRRFMTTWFNAWHLQGETSLLNSFLLHIIECYEQHYDMFSPFRIRIFGRRFLRLPLWKIFGIGFASLLILPFIILIFLKIFKVEHLRSWEWVDSWCTILSKIFLSGKDLNLDLVSPIGAGLLVLVSFFFLHRQFIPAGLSTFFELLPKGNFKLAVEKADIGSRETFRQQYWEIMQAARPDTRLVIFIDDLDRIGGDKILELLEGINFISDTASRPPDAIRAQPNTIFVLGMYTQEVARLVGTKLKEVNKAQLPEEVLGNLYIEKMVQLIVPVPFNADDQTLVNQLYEN